MALRKSSQYDDLSIGALHTTCSRRLFCKRALV
jgi:hypothetical protein